MNPFGNTHRSALLSDSSGKKKGIEGADRPNGRGQQTHASPFPFFGEEGVRPGDAAGGWCVLPHLRFQVGQRAALRIRSTHVHSLFPTVLRLTTEGFLRYNIL
jgi:hypothetical protein